MSHRRRRAVSGESPTSTAPGFTLLELMIVVTILGIIASVGVPQYVSALRTARIGKAKHELGTLSRAIDQFAATNGGNLPLTLHQVGFGGRRDPWGMPYCYLNYSDGTGDGLEWAVAAGLVDPSAVKTASSGGVPSSGSSGSSSGGSLVPSGTGGIVGRRAGWRRAPWLQSPAPTDTVTSGRTALVSAVAILADVDRDVSAVEKDALASAIVSSGSFSLYVGVDAETTRRRDRYMFPLNTDYDLFSLGPDTRTAVSLGESVGLDDVIRANNGGFFGIASDY